MNQDLTFERANVELEQAVKQLENEGLSLTESVELYARACELLGFCMKQLELSKGKIEDINERLESVRGGKDSLDE